MQNKSKNKVLFAIFILIVLLIISVLVLSVYNSKASIDIEEYKISLNNVLYDEQYSYIKLEKDAVLKKEWDGKYYLYENKKSGKYELGTETVFYDKSKNQVIVFGDVYQVFQGGDAAKKTGKTVINDLSDFQFFKLNDRKYLIIGNEIKNEDFSTANYLLVSIDKAGNASLLNNSVNIKTINPLELRVGDSKFDIANEKLLFGEDEVDLKKINGSTNQYVEKEEENSDSNSSNDNNGNPPPSYGQNNNNNSGGNSGSSNQNSQIYDDLINKIISISGLITNAANKTNLYKNISLRDVNIGASYLDVSYSIVDPENKYLSIFLTLEDEESNIMEYYLTKDSTRYRISGLKPDKQYTLSINYIERGNSSPEISDTMIVLTNTDPTSVRIIAINNNRLTYKIKMYNEFEFLQADVTLTDCENPEPIGKNLLNIQNALSTEGDIGEFILEEEDDYKYICLGVSSSADPTIGKKSYHKIKIK